MSVIRVQLWTCHHADCQRMFVHARFLAAHLVEVHNTWPPL